MKRIQNFITRPFGPLAKKAAILCLTVTLLACSAARLGYSNGETISYWWLNSYVDFDSEQKPWVRNRIDQVFAWHRKTQLKEYVRLIGRMQHRDLATVTPADVMGDYNDAKTRVLMIADRAAPELAELALSLDAEQIANIEKKFSKSNDKFRSEYLHGDVAARQEFRYRKVLKQAEYWFGNFSREQEEKIRIASNARPLNNDLLMLDRVRRQQELISLLKKIRTEKPDRDAATAMLKQFVAATVDRFGNRQHQIFFDESTAATAVMVASIMHIATPAQKAYFVRALQDWMNDFNKLAA